MGKVAASSKVFAYLWDRNCLAASSAKLHPIAGRRVKTILGAPEQFGTHDKMVMSDEVMTNDDKSMTN